MPPIVSEAKTEPAASSAAAGPTTTTAGAAPAAAVAAAAMEPEDQLGQIVKDLNEFISAKMHRVKEAMVVADLIETTKVTYHCGLFP